MITGIDHTAIASLHPLQLAGWYVEKLDLRVISENEGKIFLEANNGTVLEIIPGEGIPETPNMKDLGVRHVAFVVSDLEGSCQRLRARGIEFITEIMRVAPLQLRVIFFRDMDGNLLHLIHRENSQVRAEA